MQTEEQLKEIVRKKYSEIALQNKEINMSSCCGACGCSTEIQKLKRGSTSIFSITVYAEKPLVENACNPGSGCC